MVELKPALGVVEAHDGIPLSIVGHALHPQYGYGPALMDNHFELTGSPQVIFRRGYGYRLLCGIKVFHAFHHAFGKLRGALCLMAVHIQLACLHHPVA